MSFDTFQNNPLFWKGTDSERIEQALAWAVDRGMPLEVTGKPGGAPWLIDRAILLPENSEIRIIDCKVKLSDACRDNFIRSANCGIGIRDIKPVRNLRITGIGNAVLEGADHPRCTGDSAKVLGKRAFGTDTGKEGEVQHGDWRNIGILFAGVQDFVIENLRIVNPHCWAVSLEHCSKGMVRNLTFAADTLVDFYGKQERIRNQDGVDLRKGCRHITIDGIYGRSGDDMVALTALAGHARREAGTLESTEISAQGEAGADNDIHDVAIRNVRGWCTGGDHIIRLLNASGTKIHHVSIENVEDCTPEGRFCKAALKIGDIKPDWGGATPMGDTHHITVTNLISRRCRNTILIGGSLVDSSFENVWNLNPETEFLGCEVAGERLKDVSFTDCSRTDF